MNKTNLLTKLLATTFICGAAGVSTPAFAQDDQDQATPAQGATETGGGQTIVVTGSRIRQPNLESASPITVVNSQDVQLTGTTRAEDLINSLPQVFAGQGANISNGASGTATLNLRGLGSERTLVLINGRRLVPGDPGSSAADINIIPAALVNRVNVLTGGASSVYGSDAVSGVVNFIMDSHFEGFRFDGQYSFYQHDNSGRPEIIGALTRANDAYPRGSVADGGTYDATVAFGASFDDGRGHVTAYAGYRNINPVLQGRRDYSACALATAGANFNCGGSSTSPSGRFLTNLGSFQPTADRQLVPGFALYNFAPLNYYQRPDERYTAGLFAEYEVTPGVTPYLEFMFMDDRTVAQIAPSGDFFNTSTINCDNPLLSAQEVAILCRPSETQRTRIPAPIPTRATSATSSARLRSSGRIRTAMAQEAPARLYRSGTVTDALGAPTIRRVAYIARRNVEGGPRQDDLQHTEYRVVAGVRGDIDPVWSYDTYYQYGRTNFAETYLNDLSATRVARALNAVRDANGNVVCRAAQDGTDPNCVPWDIFALNSVSQAAVNYLSAPGFQRGIVGETVASASLTGQLGQYGIQFPWSDEGVGIAVGAEYRKESLEFNSDLEFQTGDLTGQGAPTLPVNGTFDVREGYVEVRIPIVEHSFFEEFTITGAYRYSDYQNSAGAASTPTPTRSRGSSPRSATSGSVEATTARSGRRPSRICSRPSASRSTGRSIRAPAPRRPRRSYNARRRASPLPGTALSSRTRLNSITG